jgi:hypothetical protein
MNQQGNQSTITRGVIEAVSDIALEDLSVQNADAIKGGGAGNDVYQWDPGDGVDPVHRRDLAVRA